MSIKAKINKTKKNAVRLYRKSKRTIKSGLRKAGKHKAELAGAAVGAVGAGLLAREGLGRGIDTGWALASRRIKDMSPYYGAGYKVWKHTVKPVTALGAAAGGVVGYRAGKKVKQKAKKFAAWDKRTTRSVMRKQGFTDEQIDKDLRIKRKKK